MDNRDFFDRGINNRMSDMFGYYEGSETENYPDISLSEINSIRKYSKLYNKSKPMATKRKKKLTKAQQIKKELARAKVANYRRGKAKTSGVTLVLRAPSGNLYAKGFRNSKTASKAMKGLASVGSKTIKAMPSKGYRYGAMIKRINKS